MECHALNGCVVVLKKCMNASELIRAAWALYELSTDLAAHLAGECGACDGKCGCDGECPYSKADFSVDMQVPEEFREIADIPDDAVLHVEFPEKGILLCESTGDPPELWDVPAPMMEGLLAVAVVDELFKVLMLDYYVLKPPMGLFDEGKVRPDVMGLGGEAGEGGGIGIADELVKERGFLHLALFAPLGKRGFRPLEIHP